MKVYIAGPISADKTRTFEEKSQAFKNAAAALSTWGYEPVNPLEVEPNCILSSEDCKARTKHPERAGQAVHAWECYMKADLHAMLECDGVALLPGWDESPGALREYQIATLVGMDVRPFGEWLLR